MDGEVGDHCISLAFMKYSNAARRNQKIPPRQQHVPFSQESRIEHDDILPNLLAHKHAAHDRQMVHVVSQPSPLNP